MSEAAPSAPMPRYVYNLADRVLSKQQMPAGGEQNSVTAVTVKWPREGVEFISVHAYEKERTIIWRLDEKRPLQHTIPNTHDDDGNPTTLYTATVRYVSVTLRPSDNDDNERILSEGHVIFADPNHSGTMVQARASHYLSKQIYPTPPTEDSDLFKSMQAMDPLQYAARVTALRIAHNPEALLSQTEHALNDMIAALNDPHYTGQPIHPPVPESTMPEPSDLTKPGILPDLYPPQPATP